MAVERWEANSQITAEHLNAMITATEEAQTTANQSNTNASLANSKADAATTKVNGFNSRISSLEGSISNHETRITNSETQVDNLSSRVTNEVNRLSSTDSTLNERINSVSSTATGAQNVTNAIVSVFGQDNTLTNNLNSLLSIKTQVEEAASGFDNNLDKRLDGIDSKITTDILAAKAEAKAYAKAYADDKLSTIVTYSDFNDLATRVTGIDGGIRDDVGGKKHNERILALENQVINDPQSGSNIKSNVAALITEIEAAHRQNNDTLDARFDDIDYEISHEKDTQNENDLGGLVQQLAEVKAIANSAASATEINERLDAIDDNTNEESLISRVNTIESNLNTSETGINDRLTAVETLASNAASASSVSTLNDRVNLLETKDTIIISQTDFEALVPDTTNVNADYIVGPDEDNKYIYYRFIQDENEDWIPVMISGGGTGGGTSSAIVCSSEAEFNLIDPKDENTDYYVLIDNIYHHYRYLNNTVIEIGHIVDESSLASTISTNVTSTINAEFTSIFNDIKAKNKRYRVDISSQEGESGTNYYLDLYEFGNDEIIPESSDNYTEQQRISRILLPATGGGGAVVSAKMVLARRTPQNYYVLESANTIELSVFFSSYDSDSNETYNGNYTLYRGNSIVDSGEILTDSEHLTDATGEYITKTFDIKRYCQSGTQNFRLVVTDTAGNMQTREWRVELVALRVESSFNDQTTYTAKQSRKISITPYGSGGISKTVVLKVDNASEGDGYQTLTTTSSGIPQEITIPATVLTPGAHLIEIYVKQIIGTNVEPTSSDSIYKDLICIDNTITDPIISSIYRRDEINTQNPIKVPQYTSLQIPYYVYDSTTDTPTVVIEKTFNNNTITVTENLEQNSNVYIFKGEQQGNYTLTISCGNNSIIIPISVTELGYNISQVTDGLIFDFNPVGLSNTSTNRMWTNNIEGYENIQFEIPIGKTFDWYNGGYQIDENNNTYFCIKAGSRIAIKASLFDKNFFNNSNTGIEDNGAEFKCIFKTTNVKQGNAVFLTCQDQDAINITTYDTDVTSINEFKDYLTVVEIYNTETNNVVAVCNPDIDNITAIAATYGENISTRTQTNNELLNATISLIYNSANLKRYQVLNSNNEEVCIFEEEYNSEHSGWLITRIKPVLEITSTNLGLEMKVHEVNITSRSGILTTPYSEDDIIEFEYNINSKNNGSYVLAYEDGVSTLPLLYYSVPNRDNFLHTNPGYIILGSDDCDLHIYRMKFYNKFLTSQQILMNFYADAADGEDMVNRYERNIKLYNDPQSENGVLTEITPQSVAAACPDLKIIMIEAPNLTGGKNSFIKDTKIRCIQKNGRPEDNWVAFNGYHSGQGTSSDNYGMAGRNLDIIFGFNGVDTIITPSLKNNYSFDENYKSVIVTGVTNNYDDIGDYNSTLTDLISEYNSTHVEPINENDLTGINEIQGISRHMYLNGTGRVGLSSTSVPNNWFNIKVNIASSENANNALLQKRFDRYLPYRNIVPAMKRDNKIKNDMEFYNCIIFIKETGTPTEFTNDNGVNRSWHFYGIGNIGDSKKTDETRVNIPGDPNEFCVEISDNGLANSGFSSGVYYTNEEQTATSYTETNYGLKYPITISEWENVNNKAHSLLYDFSKKGGWEKSFEFRYDITTKDGNTIEESGAAGELATARQLQNKTVFADMYSWVVTASDSDFSNQLQDWFIEDSPLYWYLFTERYTMIDSRAKNTFWHYGKVYISTNEYNGTNITTFENELESLTEGTAAYAAKQTQINVAQFIYNNRDTFIKDDEKAAIHNGYRFELWDYDNDTALGINNNGKMVFNYGLEDIDKLANGDPVYNEQESVFWRRIRNLSAKLTTVYNKVNFDCWNAENLIQEFDAWQEQFPEELWRLDFERKYLRPYLVYHENKYLRDMANGRKKYQRRQFERNMAIYIHSKYNINQSYDPTDIIEFRTRASSMQGLKLVIKPYGKMYVNIKFGDTSTIQRLVQAGDIINIDPPPELASATNTQNIIYNASRIQEIGSLAAWQLDTMSFSKAIKLQKLILGAEAPFKNNYPIELILANPILEELDIRNYTNMNNLTLDLTKCQNLKVLKAQGTNLQVVNFANGGLLEEAYLPSTITGIYLKNLKYLNTYSLETYTNVDTIESLGTNYNIYNLVLNTLNYLTNINIDSILWSNITQTTMEKLYGINNSILKGTINMTGTVEEGALKRYREKWLPRDLTIDTSEATVQLQHKIIFYNSIPTVVGNDLSNVVNTQTSEILYETYVNEGTYIGTLGDPASNGSISLLPTYEDNKYTYKLGNQSSGGYNAYSGWRNSLSNEQIQANTWINSDMSFYAVYQANKRMFTVNWYKDTNENNSPLYSTSVEYNSEAVYGGIMPTIDTVTPNSVYKIFTGWDKSTGTITGNLNVHGTWSTSREASYIANLMADPNSELSSLSEEDLYAYSRLFKSRAVGELYGNYHLDDAISIRMGNDPEFSGIESKTIIDVENPKFFNTRDNYSNILICNGQTWNGIQTDTITPFSDNKPFVLAIDFKLNNEMNAQNNGSTLVSCYKQENDTTNGFRLAYSNSNTGPVITWGTSNVQIGNNSTNGVKVGGTVNSHFVREMVVLRYPADGTGTLYVYHTYNSNSPEQFNNNVIVTELTKDTETIINNPLIFGALGYVDGTAADGGIGTIYWAKIWYGDLGPAVCRSIASWTREKINLRLCSFNSTNSSTNVYPMYQSESGNIYTGLSFMMKSALNGKGYNVQTTKNNNGTEGWKTNPINTFLNNRFYNSLPIKWRSIIMQTPLKTYKLTTDGSGNTSFEQIWTNSYIYLPALNEMIQSSEINSVSSIEAQTMITTESSKAINWIQNFNKQRLQWDNQNNQFNKVTPAYPEDSRIRFQGYDIPDDAKIFYLPNTNPYNLMNTNSSAFDRPIKQGDIWLKTAATSSNSYTAEAYMFISLAEIELNHPPISSTYLCQDTSGNIVGGWLPAIKWATRTVKISNNNGIGDGPYYFDERGEWAKYTNLTMAVTPGICLGFSL